jgi:hypothetical protein
LRKRWDYHRRLPCARLLSTLPERGWGEIPRPTHHLSQQFWLSRITPESPCEFKQRCTLHAKQAILDRHRLRLRKGHERVSQEQGTSKPDALDVTESSRPFWQSAWELAVHTIVGTVIFVVIAGAAIFVHFISVFFRSHGVDETIIIGLRIAEYAIFSIDLLLFLTFMFRTIARSLKQL